MSDFDGINKGTTSRLTMAESQPLTAEVLKNAADTIAAAAPVPPCGTEERPHHFFGEAKVGARVTCAVCADRLIVLPDGRAMTEPALGDFFRRMPPLRLLEVSEDPLTDGALAFRYTMETLRPRVFYDLISVGYDWAGRPPRRVRLPNRTRSTVRTDFGARWPQGEREGS